MHGQRARAPLALIFDVDGTLVDSNWVHVEAWRRAFAEHGYEVSRARIVPEIGKGGDQLMPAIIGEDAAQRVGDALSETEGRCFDSFMERVKLELFPCAVELLEELRDRGVGVALATSSEADHFDRIGKSDGVDLGALADVVVTGNAAERSKPAPDLITAAVHRLKLSPEACLMIGDTVHDARACVRAGVSFGAVLCGGGDRGELRKAGATHVWRDLCELQGALDALLDTAAASGRG
jgi:HAD superfamily hydrolase (TIGR01509 family)